MLRKGWARTVVGALLISALTVIQVGCTPTVSGSASVTVTCHPGSGCNTTAQGTITISDVARASFTSGTSPSSVASYNFIWNVPSSDLVLNTQSPVQGTLTAVTDTNYQSSITLTLSPVASTTQPVEEGYTVHTFGTENTTELSNWISQVSANTKSSVNLNLSGSALFNQLGNAGTYTAYVEVSSSQAGVTPLGSATYSDPGSKPLKCVNGNCPIQPPPTE